MNTFVALCTAQNYDITTLEITALLGINVYRHQKAVDEMGLSMCKRSKDSCSH